MLLAAKGKDPERLGQQGRREDGQVQHLLGPLGRVLCKGGSAGVRRQLASTPSTGAGVRHGGTLGRWRLCQEASPSTATPLLSQTMVVRNVLFSHRDWLFANEQVW